MADVVPFPIERCTRTNVYRSAAAQLEDIAELLDGPDCCGRADALRLQCRLLVEHFGVQQTLDLLETAQFYVASLRGKTPPPRGAA